MFDRRRGGEDYNVFVMRADAARMKCENDCDRTDDCRDYAVRVSVSGITAGSLYEEGVELPWPKPRAVALKRKSLCCKECEVVYIAGTDNPLCPNCRRNAYVFFTRDGGEAVGENPGSDLPHYGLREAA